MSATVETYDIGAVDRAETFRYLGYRGQEMTSDIEGRIDEGLARAAELARPHASWSAFAIAERTEAEGGTPLIRLGGCSLELPGVNIARHLEGACEAVILAATTGLMLDRELRRLSATEPAAEAILDAAGTQAIEQTADAASASIRAWAAARGLATGARFSPGYGDLPLACQPEVLRVVDAQRRLGITLADSLLMTPVKSVTAIIGVFDDAGLAERAARRSGAAG